MIMSNIVINAPQAAPSSVVVEISVSAEEKVKLSENPSGRQSVLRLKLLAAAFITECEKAPKSAGSDQPWVPGQGSGEKVPGQGGEPYPFNPMTGAAWSPTVMDSRTGQPYPYPGGGEPPAPSSGLPAFRPGSVNPTTGRPWVKGEADPATGQVYQGDSDPSQMGGGQFQYGGQYGGQYGNHQHGQHGHQGQYGQGGQYGGRGNAVAAMLAALDLAVKAAEAAPADY
jgi:hypothetical protein